MNNKNNSKQIKQSSPQKAKKQQSQQNSKEENLREILNFLTNQVDVRKFLKKMKAVVDSNQQEMKIQDDFLNPNEYQEVQQIYEDYNVGDLVIVFNNPDFEGIKNQPITFREAEKIYEEILTQKNDDVSESQLKKEKEAFMLAFLTLDDYQDDKTKKKRKQQEIEEKRRKTQLLQKYLNQDENGDDDLKSALQDKSPLEQQLNKKSQSKSDSLQQQKNIKKDSAPPLRIRGQISQFSQNSQKRDSKQINQSFNSSKNKSLVDQLSVEQKHEEEKQENSKNDQEDIDSDENKDIEQNNQVLSSYEIYQKFMKKYQDVLKKKAEREEFDKLSKEKSQRKSTLDNKKNSLSNIPKSPSLFGFDQITSPQIPQRYAKSTVTLIEEIKHMDPIKELFKVKLNDTKQFKKVKKQLCQGQYLQKETTDKGDNWICSNSSPKDFMTLIRFTVIEKLMRNGFLHCRQFISTKGDQIIIVIKSTKEIIMRQAQKIKVTKQIELGFADLFSLEPVDKKLRPLRLKKYIRSYQSNSEEDQKIQSLLVEMASQQKTEEKVSILRPGEKVEDHCKQIYQKVCLWDNFNLRFNLIKKQLEVDVILKQLAKKLNIDQSWEKTEILADDEITKEEWQTYYIYLETILCFGEWIAELKKKGFKELDENQAFLYKLVFRKALGDANDFWFQNTRTFWRDLLGYRYILYNMWGRLQIDPIAPYTEFFIPQNEDAKQLWRKYEINEKNLRSEFLNMEKIRLTSAIVLKHVNILMMLQQQHALSYIPLHDQYQLKGQPKSLLFQNLQDNDFIKKFEKSIGDKKLKEVFVQLKAQAESTDYDSISVKQDSTFDYRLPWHVPIQTYRDYFGEKIAIYFLFLTFYTKQLWYLSVLGIIAQGLLEASSKDISNIITVLFSFLIIVWSTFFIEYWRQQEVIFSLQFGQQNIEQDSAERPAFRGRFIRSIINDNINEQFYSPLKRQMWQLLAFGVSLIIISASIASVIGILIFKNTMIEQQAGDFWSQTIPGIANSIQIQVFTFVYFFVAKGFNIVENHKILTTFENSLIVKNFIFRFVNNFNSFFIISFLSDYFASLKICKVSEAIPNDCYQVLSTQMRTIFTSNLVGSIPNLIVPFVKEFAMKELKNRILIEKNIQHPFNSIDTMIEDQLNLDPYQTTEEVDGSVEDYMGIAIQFSYLIIFGVSFPACFIMAFAQNIFKIQVDKLKFLLFTRRPFPQGACSIGNWLIILDIITFLGIFVNAGLITFTSGFIKNNQALYFPLILILFLILKYIIRFIIPSYPERASILNARHKCIINKVVKGLKSNQKSQLIQTDFYSTIGGVQYTNQQSDVNSIQQLQLLSEQLIQNK